MDSMITAAARALAAGDALGALKRVSLRNDPPALALRGIAMAQLGEYPNSRKLLQRAAGRFGRTRSARRPHQRAAGAADSDSPTAVARSPRRGGECVVTCGCTWQVAV